MRTALVMLLFGALLAGCGDHDTFSTAATMRTDALPRVHVEGTAFRDAAGRQVLLRGYNARVLGIFDVTFDDGRIFLETILPFDEAAASRLEQLGLNVLRLPINWSGLEPHPQQYSESYMQHIDTVVELGRRHHFYVLIDMHQDAYSKEIGEDGAPLWAIIPQPQQLLQGPLNNLDQRRLSPAAINAGNSFFKNRAATDGRPLQAAFTTAVQQLVQRYAGSPIVVGYEAFNEPIILTASPDPPLDAFHQRFADAVHAIDPDVPVFFEPNATRNQTDSARIPAAPWPNGPGVYAPHIYTTVFSKPNDSWASQDPAVLAPSMEAAANEAAAWGTPIFVTEFGIDQTLADDRGPRYLEAELDLQDRFLASSTIWVWREEGYWGLLTGDGQERTATVRTVSRPNPRAVAGDLLAIDRPAPGSLLVHYRQAERTHGQPHEVSASPDHLSSYEIRCDGTRVAAQRLPGRAQFTCPDAADGSEHTFEVIGTPVE